MGELIVWNPKLSVIGLRYFQTLGNQHERKKGKMKINISGATCEYQLLRKNVLPNRATRFTCGFVVDNSFKQVFYLPKIFFRRIASKPNPVKTSVEGCLDLLLLGVNVNGFHSPCQ